MKIFVTLGSSTQNFNRLLGKIDELIDENVIKDVVVQSNSTDYVPKNYKIKNHLKNYFQMIIIPSLNMILKTIL